MNTTLSSAVFVDLFTIPVVLAAATKLVVQFTAGVSSTVGTPAMQMSFRIVVDATVYDAVGLETFAVGHSGCVSLLKEILGLAAGAHVVHIQWRVPLGTGQIRPVTHPDTESANAVLWEVSV